jgi:hypothetical protein
MVASATAESALSGAITAVKAGGGGAITAGAYVANMQQPVSPQHEQNIKQNAEGGAPYVANGAHTVLGTVFVTVLGSCIA